MTTPDELARLRAEAELGMAAFDGVATTLERYMMDGHREHHSAIRDYITALEAQAAALDGFVPWDDKKPFDENEEFDLIARIQRASRSGDGFSWVEPGLEPLFYRPLLKPPEKP